MQAKLEEKTNKLKIKTWEREWTNEIAKVAKRKLERKTFKYIVYSTTHMIVNYVGIVCIIHKQSFQSIEVLLCVRYTDTMLKDKFSGMN